MGRRRSVGPMVYHGTIKQGMVVLDEVPPLKDGTRVEVQLVEADQPEGQSFHPVGSWDGPPGELDRLLAEVQSLRDADVSLEAERGEDDQVSP